MITVKEKNNEIYWLGFVSLAICGIFFVFNISINWWIIIGAIIFIFLIIIFTVFIFNKDSKPWLALMRIVQFIFSVSIMLTVISILKIVFDWVDINLFHIKDRVNNDMAIAIVFTMIYILVKDKKIKRN